MSATIFDGKHFSDIIIDRIFEEIEDTKITPGLAAILIGENTASSLYVELKRRACEEVGINFSTYVLDNDTPQEKVLEVIKFLNEDDEINGIITQLPLPPQFDTNKIISAIDPKKDVDGFHPQNIQDIIDGKREILPVMGSVITTILNVSDIPIHDAKVTIIANSDVFSKPITPLLEELGASVTFITPDTKNIEVQTKQSDILIVAVGKPKFITKEMVKEGCAIIDIGINLVDGKTVGDVDPKVDEKVAFRTPVPGGVGPMTVALLLKNVLELYKVQNK